MSMTMTPIRYTRNLFLRGICVVYLFAFISFYIQIPGLYGDNGILPARSLLENSKHKSLSARVHYQPTLLWLAPYLGLDIQYALDFLSLLGTFLAFTGFVSQKFCTVPLFAGLWSLYFSLYQIGQNFLSVQWDGLLLEAGFISLLVAPLLPGKRRGSKGTPSDAISFWLVRWLLFRFLFTCGISKLISGCPKWWDLTALTYYFESMPIPSPLAWYCHYIPISIMKALAVHAHFCEIFLPILFFAPIRAVRITGFIMQILLQICIVLTGNFNFLNMLLVALSISLLDDQFFFGRSRKASRSISSILGHIANIIIYAGVLYVIAVLFNFKLNGTQVDFNMGFSKEQFEQTLPQVIQIFIYIGLGSLGFTSARATAMAVLDTSGAWAKIVALIKTLLYTVLAVLVFAASTVPLSSLHVATNSTTSPAIRTVHNRLNKLHVVNQYGIFKRMTGVNGRLEIVLEGSDNIEGPWLEYQFLYKPGNVNHSLPFVAPYAPRLDTQMWWAAQTTYQQQPWILSLAHRLLNGKIEVLSLFDTNHSPFMNKPPKFLRATLYNYKYTTWNQREKPQWWSRERVGEYFPAYTKDNPTLLDYLRSVNLMPVNSIRQKVNPIWKQIFDGIRYVTGHLEATLLLWSVFTSGCAIITTTTKSN